MLKDLFLVFVGGGFGSVCRYALSVWLKPLAHHGFPVHTFSANVLGCLLIGLLMGLLAKHPGQSWQLLLVTGLCGGFTTFSTFSSECFALFRGGDVLMGLAYAVSSLAVCLIMVAAGFWMASIK